MQQLTMAHTIYFLYGSQRRMQIKNILQHQDIFEKTKKT